MTPPRGAERTRATTAPVPATAAGGGTAATRIAGARSRSGGADVALTVGRDARCRLHGHVARRDADADSLPLAQDRVGDVLSFEHQGRGAGERQLLGHADRRAAADAHRRTVLELDGVVLDGRVGREDEVLEHAQARARRRDVEERDRAGPAGAKAASAVRPRSGETREGGSALVFDGDPTAAAASRRRISAVRAVGGEESTAGENAGAHENRAAGAAAEALRQRRRGVGIDPAVELEGAVDFEDDRAAARVGCREDVTARVVAAAAAELGGLDR